MDGDLLTIEQVCLLSGKSESQVKRALKREELLDLKAVNVGDWLRFLVEDQISKHKFRLVSHEPQEPLHRKWY